MNLPRLDLPLRQSAASRFLPWTIGGLLYLAVVAVLIRNGSVDTASFTAWIALGGGLLATLAAGKLFGVLLARRRSTA